MNARETFRMVTRMLFGIVLFLVAIYCALMGSLLLLDLADQSRINRIYYDEFKVAAEYVRRTGRVPERPLTQPTDGRSIYPLGLDGADCGPDFSKLASDRFVLSFWRGEWTECYAFPSGRTTLAMSVGAYMRSGFWQLFVGVWAMGIAALWGAIRLTRRLRLAAVAARDTS